MSGLRRLCGWLPTCRDRLRRNAPAGGRAYGTGLDALAPAHLAAKLDGTMMINFAAFLYTLLAVFVLASISRNRREQRPDTPILSLVGWGLMSASFTLAALLLGLDRKSTRLNSSH